MNYRTKAAFVTIGQSPRIDLVPEMRSELAVILPDHKVDITEIGVLDGLSCADVDEMRARPDEARFVTRLADGCEIVVSRQRIEAALNTLLAQIDGQFNLIVLLCTGTSIARPGKSLLIEAQGLVDGMTAAIASGVRKLGVLIPDKAQIDGFRAAHALPEDTRCLACSPYADGDFEGAGRALSGCDLIVMHCMGYTAEMASQVRLTSNAYILLSRRMVTAGIAQILG
jgi:AroM protein.